MRTFTSRDMRRRLVEVQEAALREPVLITFEGRGRLVLMAADAYEGARPEREPEAVAEGDVRLPAARKPPGAGGRPAGDEAEERAGRPAIRQRNPFPKGCGYFTDSRGKRRLRFRMKGRKTVYPKGAPGTPQFLAEWNVFMEGAEQAGGETPARGRGRPPHGR